jgi:hypothetical protein
MNSPATVPVADGTQAFTKPAPPTEILQKFAARPRAGD